MSTLLFALCGALAFGTQDAHLSEQGEPRNVVLVSMDVTRRDRLGFHGGPAATPHLDALAKEGVVFERAFAPTPVTLPSHASLFTGVYPARHGVRDNGIFRLEESATTLAERLHAKGLATAAIVSAFVLDGQFGLAQGFEHYDDRFQTGLGGMLGREERSATEVTDAALRWLDAREEEAPFFLFVHYFDPHHPYEPPEPFASAAAHPYDGEIAYMDSEIGRLFAALRERELFDDTLVIVTADHGESLGEHGEETHGIFLYESTTAVPLVVRGPGIEGGRRLSTAVSLVDVAPTILAAMGAPLDDAMQGRSLWPAIAEGAELAEEPVFLEARSGYHSFGWAPLAAIVDGSVKYIRAPKPELYDLARDPGEATNVIGERTELSDALRARLDAWLAANDAPDAWQSEVVLTDEDRERLAALGYTIAAPNKDGALESARDPKDALEEFSHLQRAGRAQEEGQFEEALRLYDAVLARNPHNFTALERSGMALLNLGRYEQAIERLERSNLFAGLPMFSLAQAHARVGNIERALAILDEVRSRNTKFMPAHLFFAQYHEAQGELAPALEAYRVLLANWYGDEGFRGKIEARIADLDRRLK